MRRSNSVEVSKTLIIVPAYNEESRIRSVIEDLKGHGYDDILVVDDCSEDATFSIICESGIYVARHVLNRGAGAASATGFEIAKVLKPDIIVTFDADGQHDAGDIERLAAPIKAQEADVVIGSRMLAKNSGMPWHRILCNRMANIVTFMVYGFSVSDTQSGLKAFSRKAYSLINIETTKMEFCSEIIFKIKEKGLRFKEVPVRCIYSDYSLSKGQSFFVGIKTFFRLIISRLLGG